MAPAYASGVVAKIMGYGATMSTGGPTAVLQVADPPLRSDSTMAQTFSWNNVLMIGAGSADQTTCFGDSGGPLVVGRSGRVVQVGVTSFGAQGCDHAAGFAELNGPPLAWIATRVPSIMDSWGACTAPTGGVGTSEATYVPANTTGPQADGTYYWQIWCWAPTVAVPDLRGLTSAAVTSALQARGLVRGTTTYAVDWTCNNIGRVTAQTPLAGAAVAAGSTVSFTIARQPSTACP